MRSEKKKVFGHTRKKPWDKSKRGGTERGFGGGHQLLSWLGQALDGHERTRK